jgi:transcriptional regulator with XRE-family HTH domain
MIMGPASAPQIGAAVRFARESKGMSQAELAQRARVTQATVSRIESGARRGDIETLALIAAGLGLALWILVRRAEALRLLVSLPRS